MGALSHRKISTVCVVIIFMFTFGLQAILVKSQSTTKSVISTVTNGEIGTSSSFIESNDYKEMIADVIKLDLDKAETSKDSHKIEIIKQIQKLNNDGSYTVGYEAEDGTFKIESRDVLGNVKGTFGYVDANGEIKRVSYLTNNGTEIKNSNIPSFEDEVVQAQYFLKNNRSVLSSTTRRPFHSSTTVSPRPTVVQTVPKRFRNLSPSTERNHFKEYVSTTTKVPKLEETTTVIYATSVPSQKPYITIRPTPLPGTNIRLTEQLARPEKLEINHVSKVQHLPKQNISTFKPVVEEIEENEKTEEKKSIRGNVLRRQLMQGADSNSRHQFVFSSSSDEPDRHIFGSSGSTSRPLYSTTNNPRIPALVLAARQRAAQIQNTLNSNSSPSTSTEKYYIKSPTRKQDHTFEENEPTTESTSEQTYLTPNPIQVQIPASRVYFQNDDEEKQIIRRPTFQSSDTGRYRSSRLHQSNIQTPDAPRLVRIPIPQTVQSQVDENDQYLRETVIPTEKNEQAVEQEPVTVRIPGGYFRASSQQTQSQEQTAGSFYVPPSQISPIPYTPYPHRAAAVFAPYNHDYSERPLTTRDFERILQILIYRHQQLQRFGGSYLGGPSYQGHNAPYPYAPPFVHPYVHQPYFNPYYNSYRNSLVPYSDPENMYQAQTPVISTDNPITYELQRLIPRRKQYSPSYFGAQTGGYSMNNYHIPVARNSGGSPNLVPPDVREELLYRMLMLALQTEPQPVVATPTPNSSGAGNLGKESAISTSTKSSLAFKKPVRSVQILGEQK